MAAAAATKPLPAASSSAPSTASTRPPRPRSSATASTRPPRTSASGGSSSGSSGGRGSSASGGPGQNSRPGPAKGQPTFSAATQGAGVFLALFLYPLALNLLTGGRAQAAGWLKAKFINKPYGGASSTGPTTKSGFPVRPTPTGKNTTPTPIYQLSN